MKSIEALEAFGINFSLIRATEPLHTADDVARFCECSLEQVVKTIICVGRDKKVAALIGGNDFLDSKKLSRLNELPSNKLRMATPEEVVAITAYNIGSVSPAGLPEIVCGFIDSKLLSQNTVIIGSGVPDVLIQLNPHDILALPGFTQDEISK